MSIRRWLLGEITAEVTRRQRSAGETWGKQQATIARHREDHILHYQPSITAKVQEVLDAALRAHDARLVDELERQLREKSYCVAAGPQEVIDALRNGQVGYPGYLVLEPDRGQVAARCPGCGSVFTREGLWEGVAAGLRVEKRQSP